MPNYLQCIAAILQQRGYFFIAAMFLSCSHGRYLLAPLDSRPSLPSQRPFASSFLDNLTSHALFFKVQVLIITL